MRDEIVMWIEDGGVGRVFEVIGGAIAAVYWLAVMIPVLAVGLVVGLAFLMAPVVLLVHLVGAVL